MQRLRITTRENFAAGAFSISAKIDDLSARLTTYDSFFVLITGHFADSVKRRRSPATFLNRKSTFEDVFSDHCVNLFIQKVPPDHFPQVTDDSHPRICDTVLSVPLAAL
jgi:hypothetical protein